MSVQNGIKYSYLLNLMHVYQMFNMTGYELDISLLFNNSVVFYKGLNDFLCEIHVKQKRSAKLSLFN